MKNRKFEHKKISEIIPRHWGQLLIRDVNKRDPSSEILSFTQIELPPETSLPSIRHNRTVEIVYILEGSASVLLDSTDVLLEMGDYLCFDKGTWHSFRSGTTGVKALSLYFPPINLSQPDVEINKELENASFS